MMISVVIPTFNEEARIRESVFKIKQYLESRSSDYEILISDSLSADRTFTIAKELSSNEKRIKALKTEQNGKGAAVRAGVLHSEGELVLFSDADLSSPVEELEKLERALEEGNDIAIASRGLKGSDIFKHQPWHREFSGKVLNMIIQILYLPGISDTQCGFKLFRRDIARELFSKQKINGFLFDVEVLYMARRKGLKIKEVPVKWAHKEPSKVSIFKLLPQITFDLLRIGPMVKKNL